MNRIIGITIDTIEDLDKTIAALKSLPAKVWARAVFDEGCKAVEYLEAMQKLKPVVAGIMGELLDSFYVKDTSLKAYAARAIDYERVLGPYVDYWEIGNEMNGPWLGKRPWEKFNVAHQHFKEKKRKTSVTFYDTGDYGWTTWARANLSKDLLNSVDWALMSSYPHDNEGKECSWPATIQMLSEVFPNASGLGVGECGMDPEKFGKEDRAKCMDHYYSDVFTRVTHPKFIGGGFFWYWRDCLPPGSLLRPTLEGYLRRNTQ